VIITGFRVGGARRAAFGAEYFRRPATKAIVEEYKKAFPDKGDKLPTGCYPDMGNGRFSEALTMSEWYKFNCAQRAHYNLLEWATPFIVFLLVGGLFHADLAFYCGVAWIVGRELYTSGYIANGPGGRSIGAAVADIAAVVVLGAACHGVYPMIAKDLPWTA
jgi:uncharacterized membrane protein YecN with MAPEG domain